MRAHLDRDLTRLDLTLEAGIPLDVIRPIIIIMHLYSCRETKCEHLFFFVHPRNKYIIHRKCLYFQYIFYGRPDYVTNHFYNLIKIHSSPIYLFYIYVRGHFNTILSCALDDTQVLQHLNYLTKNCSGVYTQYKGFTLCAATWR